MGDVDHLSRLALVRIHHVKSCKSYLNSGVPLFLRSPTTASTPHGLRQLFQQDGQELFLARNTLGPDGGLAPTTGETLEANRVGIVDQDDAVAAQGVGDEIGRAHV